MPDTVVLSASAEVDSFPLLLSKHGKLFLNFIEVIVDENIIFEMTFMVDGGQDDSRTDPWTDCEPVWECHTVQDSG